MVWVGYWPGCVSIVPVLYGWGLHTGMCNAPMCLRLSLGFFASFAAPFGGFLSSAIKRAYGIKDFNNLIPGHGGPETCWTGWSAGLITACIQIQKSSDRFIQTHLMISFVCNMRCLKISSDRKTCEPCCHCCWFAKAWWTDLIASSWCSYAPWIFALLDLLGCSNNLQTHAYDI